MKRAFVFIDGTWLWHNIMQYNLSNPNKIDLGNLPHVLITEFSIQKNIQIEHIGTILTASVPINVSIEDKSLVDKRYHFFDLLRSKYGFTLDLHEIDFKGRRLKKSDRLVTDKWSPKEKCVDISMASNLFYYINQYDIAICITGDRDFKPAFDRIKLLDKDLIIASFKQSLSKDLLTNYSCILIDDLILENKLTLK